MKDQDQKHKNLGILNFRISQGNLEDITKLLDKEDFSLHDFDIDYKLNPLIRILQSNNPILLDKNIFQKIIAKGVSISVIDPETGNNILYELIAARTRIDSNDAGKIQEINELIEIIIKEELKLYDEEKKASLNAIAAEHGFNDIVEMFLKSEDIVRMLDSISSNKTSEILNQEKPKLTEAENIQKRDNFTRLNVAIKGGNYDEISNILDGENFSLEGYEPTYKSNPLSRILQSNNSKLLKKDLFEKIIAKGVSANIKDSSNNQNILHELITARAKINPADKVQIQELNNIIEVILKHNPRLQYEMDESGMNSISLAVENGLNDIAKMLLKYKANPNSKLNNQEGSDLLSVAIEEENIELIQILLRNEEANKDSLPLNITLRHALEIFNLARGNKALYEDFARIYPYPEKEVREQFIRDNIGKLVKDSDQDLYWEYTNNDSGVEFSLEKILNIAIDNNHTELVQALTEQFEKKASKGNKSVQGSAQRKVQDVENVTDQAREQPLARDNRHTELVQVLTEQFEKKASKGNKSVQGSAQRKVQDVENVTDQDREQPQKYKNLGLLNFYISEGNIEEITKLLDDKNFSLPGFDVDYIDNPLIRVLESRNSKQIKKVLYDKMLAKNVSVRDSETGMNILHELIIARIQINSDDTSKIQEINDLIEIVLEKDQTLNEDMVLSSNMNPISLAVENGFNDIAELLLRYKADPNSKLYGRDDSDLLSVAIKEKNIELIQILLKHEEDNPDSFEITPTNALELINIARNNPELFQLDKIIELLLKSKALSETPLPYKKDSSLLTAALDSKDPTLILTLLEYKSKHPESFDIDFTHALRILTMSKGNSGLKAVFEKIYPLGEKKIKREYIKNVLGKKIRDHIKTLSVVKSAVGALFQNDSLQAPRSWEAPFPSHYSEIPSRLKKIKNGHIIGGAEHIIGVHDYYLIMDKAIRDNQLEIVKAIHYFTPYLAGMDHLDFYYGQNFLAYSTYLNRNDISNFLISQDDCGFEGILALIKRKKTNQLKLLLDSGYKTSLFWNNSRRYQGNHSIFDIAFLANANLDTIRMLIENGADVNIISKRRFPPGRGRYARFKNFFNDYGDETHSTPLIYAIREGNLGLINLFIEKGANVNIEIVADRDKYKDDGYSYFIKETAKNGLVYYSTFTNPFLTAVESGDAKILRLLIEKGAKLDSRFQDRCILHAVKTGNLEIVKLVIESRDDWVFEEVIMASIDNCNFKIIDYFLTTPSLQLDIDINYSGDGPGKDDNILAKLVKVALSKRRNASYYSELSETLKIILEKGADMDGINKSGESALHLIIASGRKDLIKLFLDHSKDLQVDDQKTLLENLKKLELKKLDPDYKVAQEKIKYLKNAIDQKQAIEKKYNKKAEKRFYSALEELTIGKGKEEIDEVFTDNKLYKYMKLDDQDLFVKKAEKIKEKTKEVKLDNIDKLEAIFKGEDKVKLKKAMSELGALEGLKGEVFEKKENKLLQTEKLKQKHEKQNKGPKDKKGK